MPVADINEVEEGTVVAEWRCSKGHIQIQILKPGQEAIDLGRQLAKKYGWNKETAPETGASSTQSEASREGNERASGAAILEAESALDNLAMWLDSPWTWAKLGPAKSGQVVDAINDLRAALRDLGEEA